MIIVHVAEYASGGVATYLRNVISYQLDDDNFGKVVLFNSNFNSENINFNSKKFEKHVYSYKRSLLGIFKLLRMRKNIDKINPDIVHLHSSFAGLLRISYLLHKPDYKVVYCAHGWSFIQKNKNKLIKHLYAMIERLESKATDLIINISGNEQKEAINNGIPQKKMRIIYNTISPKVISKNVKNPFSNDSKKLMFIGRFDNAKGLQPLLDKFDFSNSNIEFVIIGEPIVNDSEGTYVNKKNIKFLGWVNHDFIDSYIKYTDAIIIPSIWEGFGLVALEAMKNSKMTLVSDVGGLSEIVEDGFNGLKFNPNSREDVYSTLKKFETMPKDEISKMGSNGRKLFYSKYGDKKIYSKLTDLYIEILSK